MTVYVSYLCDLSLLQNLISRREWEIGLPQDLEELLESCSMVLEKLGEKEAKRKSNGIVGRSRS